MEKSCGGRSREENHDLKKKKKKQKKQRGEKIRGNDWSDFSELDPDLARFEVMDESRTPLIGSWEVGSALEID